MTVVYETPDFVLYCILEVTLYMCISHIKSEINFTSKYKTGFLHNTTCYTITKDCHKLKKHKYCCETGILQKDGGWWFN